MMYMLKTGMFGWVRKVMMAMSLFVLCCTIYWASVEFLRPWTVWKIREAREEFIKAVKSW
jgi:nitrate/nitrite-specific signal transduction histidine kinase